MIVSTGSRLHLGFYNLRGGDRAYGSIGVYLDEPGWVLEVWRSGDIRVWGDEDIWVDVRRVVDALNIPGLAVRVVRSIPRHVGLGSTTQLLLALGAAASRLYERHLSIRRIALLLGRGTVSGIGVAGFEAGGFIIDSGRRLAGGKLRHPRSVHEIPRVTLRVWFPEDWRFIVLIERGKRGLRESEESMLLTPKSPLPEFNRALRLLVFRVMLPSLIRRDVRGFGSALTRLQQLVGRYFSPYQDGVFVSQEAVEALGEAGCYGVGQSSWGPATYGLATLDSLAKILGRLRDLIDLGNYIVVVAKARNRGAEF